MALISGITTRAISYLLRALRTGAAAKDSGSPDLQVNLPVLYNIVEVT